MRKKVEKYLAHKLGVDESQIKPREDGRYDGMLNDVDNLLRAVRESEPSSRGSSQSKRAKLNAASASVASASRIGFFPYPSLSTYANYLSTGESAVLPSTAWTSWASQTTSPYITAPQTPPGEKKADGECLSARKSIFDETSPGLFGGNLEERLGNSPSFGKVQGMTPGSTFGDTCTTPFPSDTQMKLSPEEAESLNKTLFSEGVMTPFPKTPNLNQHRPREAIRFHIGSIEKENKTKISNMRFGGCVPISPLADKRSRAGLYDEDVSMDQDSGPSFPDLERSKSPTEQKNTSQFEDVMPPPKPFSSEVVNHLAPSTAKKSHEKTPTRDVDLFVVPPHSIDADKFLKDLETPATSRTVEMGESFWNDDPDAGLSPMPMHFTPASRTVKASDNNASSTKKRPLSSEPCPGHQSTSSPPDFKRHRNESSSQEQQASIPEENKRSSETNHGVVSVSQ